MNLHQCSLLQNHNDIICQYLFIGIAKQESVFFYTIIPRLLLRIINAVLLFLIDRHAIDRLSVKHKSIPINNFRTLLFPFQLPLTSHEASADLYDDPFDELFDAFDGRFINVSYYQEQVPAKLPDVMKSLVIQQWLAGVPPDEIAYNNSLSAGAVTNIVTNGDVAWGFILRTNSEN